MSSIELQIENCKQLISRKLNNIEFGLSGLICPFFVQNALSNNVYFKQRYEGLKLLTALSFRALTRNKKYKLCCDIGFYDWTSSRGRLDKYGLYQVLFDYISSINICFIRIVDVFRLVKSKQVLQGCNLQIGGGAYISAFYVNALDSFNSHKPYLLGPCFSIAANGYQIFCDIFVCFNLSYFLFKRLNIICSETSVEFIKSSDFYSKNIIQMIQSPINFTIAIGPSYFVSSTIDIDEVDVGVVLEDS